MTHLVIENQNSNVEMVSVAIILKVYEMALSALGSVSLKGNLLSDHSKQAAYNYLTGNLPNTNTKRFPLLSLNVTSGIYIDFLDSLVELILLLNNIGDGIGILLSDLYAINRLEGSWFSGSNITSFNELLYFKPSAISSLGLFEECRHLTEITLPSGITSTPKKCFKNNILLETVNNTSSLTGLNDTSFEGCSNLETIDLLNIVTVNQYSFALCGNLRSIGTGAPTTVEAHAFENCSSLTSIDLSNCTTIGAWAFKGCSSLSSIDLSNITTIESNTFLECTSLTSIDLSNITTINYGAFKGCTSLLSIDLSNVTSVSGNNYENGTFMNCTSLTTVTGLENLPAIGKYAFYNCTSLGVGLNLVLNLTSATTDNYTNLDYAFYKTAYSNVELHSTVAYNLGCAFRYMPNLKKLDLSDFILGTGYEVGECYWYSSIETIILPDLQLPNMSWRAIADSTKLKTYIILSSTPPTITGSTLYWNNIVHFYVPDSAVATYQAASGWSNFASRIHGLSHSDLNDVTWYTKEHPST